MEGQSMVTRKFLASLAAASMVFGSTAASAAPAPARSSSAVDKSESMRGRSAWPIILAILIAAGVIVVISANNDINPRSP
jgi:hypothetical protein